MEFGTPSTRLRRTRGSRRSEDLAPSTPSNRSTPATGRTTPVQSRIKNYNQHCSVNHTPNSHRNGVNGDLMQTPSMKDGPQYSGAVERCGTPGGSILVSPAGTPRHHNNSTNQTPKSHKPTSVLDSSKSPVNGRMTKVFDALPFAKNFTLKEKIGEGTFSTVYLASKKEKDIKIALKHLVPTSKPGRILMETGCMRAASGHPNIIQLLGMWRVDGDIVLVMPYLKHSRFSDLIFSMDVKEIKNYIGNLLSALRHIHKLGIIHRDIKPSNFLYDRTNKKYALVDFGLAQFQADLKPGGQLDTGRGRKRKPSEEAPESNSRIKLEDDRQVLDNIENRLTVAGSPTIRALRDNKGVRRSPRKLMSPGGGEESSLTGICKRDSGVMSPAQNSIVLSPVKREQDSPGSPLLTPRKRLRLSTAGQKSPYLTPSNMETDDKNNQFHDSSALKLRMSPRKRLTPDLASPNPIAIRRQSPRKHTTLTRPAGFSKLTITGNTIVGSSGASTPSLSRTPSFTMLEPASYIASQTSQATDQIFGRTPILRASVTSTCSSLPLPKPKTDLTKVQCRCIGLPKVCTDCLSLQHMHAPRAGTPGFRPPEVLLKHPNQTTAIDIWAVGVIMISILSRSYPFFRAPDDMTALAELTVLFGSQQIKALAKQFGRLLTISKDSEPQDLESLCKALALRERKDSNICDKTEDQENGGGDAPKDNARKHNVTKDGIELIHLLLAVDHTNRITADEALSHPFLQKTGYKTMLDITFLYGQEPVVIGFEAVLVPPLLCEE